MNRSRLPLFALLLALPAPAAAGQGEQAEAASVRILELTAAGSGGLARETGSWTGVLAAGTDGPEDALTVAEGSRTSVRVRFHVVRRGGEPGLSIHTRWGRFGRRTEMKGTEALLSPIVRRRSEGMTSRSDREIRVFVHVRVLPPDGSEPGPQPWTLADWRAAAIAAAGEGSDDARDVLVALLEMVPADTEPERAALRRIAGGSSFDFGPERISVRAQRALLLAGDASALEDLRSDDPADGRSLYRRVFATAADPRIRGFAGAMAFRAGDRGVEAPLLAAIRDGTALVEGAEELVRDIERRTERRDIRLASVLGAAGMIALYVVIRALAVSARRLVF